MNRTNLFLALSLVAIVSSPLFGSDTLTLSDLLTPGTTSYRIFWELRLPRCLLAFAAGGALAVLGGTYQILLHNPLAEPYVLGVSNAVTLGFAIADIFFHATVGSALSLAFGGTAGLISTLLILVVCVTGMTSSNDRVLLFGMGLQFSLSSALFLLLSYHQQHMGGGSLRWFFGQLQWLGFSAAFGFLIAVLFLVGILLIFARALDALSLGDAVARSLGVAPARFRNGILFLTAILVALVVSFSGSVGFVGLVVPHVVRLIRRPESSRQLLALSFFSGGAFLVVADVLSRIILPPFEFPVGIFTTLIGGPVFLYLLWKR